MKGSYVQKKEAKNIDNVGKTLWGPLFGNALRLPHFLIQPYTWFRCLHNLALLCRASMEGPLGVLVVVLHRTRPTNFWPSVEIKVCFLWKPSKGRESSVLMGLICLCLKTASKARIADTEWSKCWGGLSGNLAQDIWWMSHFQQSRGFFFSCLIPQFSVLY